MPDGVFSFIQLTRVWKRLYAVVNNNKNVQLKKPTGTENYINTRTNVFLRARSSAVENTLQLSRPVLIFRCLLFYVHYVIYVCIERFVYIQNIKNIV